MRSLLLFSYRIANESTWQSRDGGFADESGKEYEDVSGNLRSVGFGRNPKGDSSFFIFYSSLINFQKEFLKAPHKIF